MASMLLLGVAIMLHLPSTSAQRAPDCQTHCGDVEIPYPFGLNGTGCAIEEGFEISCNKNASGIDKPFIGNVEVLNISVSHGKTRALNAISTYCYNNNTREMEEGLWSLDFSRWWPYRFSDTDNKFIVIGCNTLAYIYNDYNRTGYTTACASVCESPKALTNGSCLGVGCCQNAIPKGLTRYDVSMHIVYNDSNSSDFNLCGYAALVETESFRFSSEYITTSSFNETYEGRQPTGSGLGNWNATCELARNMSSYACRHRNSECVDSANGPGYLCSCSTGYEGNPYLPDGCRVCHNIGGYRCSCPPGRKMDKETNSCNPDINLIIGICISSIVPVIIIFCTRVIFERRRGCLEPSLRRHTTPHIPRRRCGARIGRRTLGTVRRLRRDSKHARKLTNVKKQYFQQHGGLLLFEKMKSDQGLAFTVFTEAELEQATNKFDKSEILGHGGHGTVYKGIIKDIPVAIKKCSLIDDRHKEFGKEMLILSQINHKNIVKLLGCCLEVEVPMLVYEFIQNGTLFDLIHGKNRALHVPFSSLLRIANEAADGLAFLHSYANPPILHGDVKTSNILLDENYMAKVSDFGASILAPTDEAQFVTMVQGTCRYLDPEYMQTCQLTEKSDVYSFGVVILEILTGKMPLKLESNDVHRSLSSNFLLAMKENNLDAMLDSQIKEHESMELLRGLAELAKHCLDMCSDNRPSMKEVSEELSRLRKLSKHPWLHRDTETENFLTGKSTSSLEIEESTEYPGRVEEMPMIYQSNSYYIR